MNLPIPTNVFTTVISEAIDAKRIKPFDPKLKANKHQKYIPYWAYPDAKL